MFGKKLVVGGAALAALVLTAIPVFAQFGPGQQGPNWDRRGMYYQNSPYNNNQVIQNQVIQPVAPANTASQSFYNGADQNRSVLISMRVPQNAKIWFGDAETKQTGANRQFISPPLTQNENFTYQVRVKWDDNGQPKEQTRNVTVRGGDRLNLDFGQN